MPFADHEDPRFNVKTFKKTIEENLNASRESFELLVDAYNWWQWPDNLREMNKAFPRMRREWLRQQIQMIFNADPQMLSRIVTRLAGSKSRGPRAKAWMFAKRIGTWELYHADRVLKPEQLRSLPGKFNGKGLLNPEQVRSVVDDMAEIIKSRQKIADAERINYPREYKKALERVAALLSENAALLKEIEKLREEVAWFRENVELRPVASAKN